MRDPGKAAGLDDSLFSAFDFVSFERDIKGLNKHALVQIFFYPGFSNKSELRIDDKRYELPLFDEAVMQKVDKILNESYKSTSYVFGSHSADLLTQGDADFWVAIMSDRRPLIENMTLRQMYDYKTFFRNLAKLTSPNNGLVETKEINPQDHALMMLELE